MIRIILLCLLLAGCGGCGTFPPVGSLRHVAFQIGTAEGSCTGTAVAPHWLLTAAHCLALGGPVTAVDGKPVKMLDVMLDGSDHALVRVDREMKAWAPIGKLRAGERVRMLGNPEGFTSVYRVGMVSALDALPECPNAPGMTLRRCTVILFQMVTGGGDSGAGYFNDQGELVAVHTGTFHIGFAAMAFAYPLAFTNKQLKAVQPWG